MNEVLRLLVGPTQRTEFEDGPIIGTILRLETVVAAPNPTKDDLAAKNAISRITAFSMQAADRN